MNTKLLESIGLTNAEINVYLALIELGPSTTGPIVEKSRASSSKIYELLEKLMQKGLASFVIQSGTKYFSAAPPRRLLDYMHQKEESLTLQTRELASLIPELELKEKQTHGSEATIYKGLKGVKTAYESILKTLATGDEYFVIGGMQAHPAYFAYLQEFHRRRSKQKIAVKLLYTEPAKQLADTLRPLPKTTIRFAPHQFLASSFVVMYATKTLITVATEDDLTLFQINSKGVTDSFIAQFMLLWNLAKK